MTKTVDELRDEQAEAKAAAEEWSPPVLPALPDTTGWGTADLEALALERCRLRKDTQRQRGKEPVACKRCLQEALIGRDPLTPPDGQPVTILTLLAAIPPPATGFSPLHRRLLEILVDRGERDLRTLQEMTSASETNCSARLRDLRKYGYPVARRKEGGRPLYRLAV
jgi:hypothetical protein